MRRLTVRTAAVTAMLAAACTSAHAAPLYVQGASATLRAQPDYAAAIVANVERGTALEPAGAAEGTGAWLPVSYRGQKAWAPRSLLGAAPPKARFSLTDLAAYLGRMIGTRVDSRQRVSDSTLIVTGVRGLGAEDRARREDRGAGPRDYTALERIEALELTDQEIHRFHDELRRGAETASR
jgi:hypothetical protein